MSELERQLLNRRMPPMVPKASVGLQARSLNSSRSRFDYSPLHWSKYFGSKRDLKLNDDSFRVYLHGFDGNQSSDCNLPVVVLLHGGGYSGLTFGPFVKEIEELCECRLLAIDMRGHGNTVTTNDEDLSVDTLTTDILNIITNLFSIESIPPLILMGHSMGRRYRCPLRHKTP